MVSMVSPRFAPPANHFGHAGIVRVIDSGDVTVGANNLALNDTIKVFQVKKGFRVTGVMLVAGDLETGTTLTLSVGDLADDDRFLAASAVGQAGGTANTLAATGLAYKFTADTDIYVKVKAAATTPTGGAIRVHLQGVEESV
jgi:hypothetical protein